MNSHKQLAAQGSAISPHISLPTDQGSAISPPHKSLPTGCKKNLVPTGI